MPFEHEQKFILDREMQPEWMFRFPGVEMITTDVITQIYMDDGVRLRRAVRSDSLLPDTHKDTVYTLTYKRSTREGPLEIETEIEPKDFGRLAQLAERRINKTRHTFTTDTAPFFLELDVFPDNDGTIYLVKMEVEYDLDQKEQLDVIEAMLKPKLVLRVPDGDKRWSNYKLADRYYALGLCAEAYAGDARRFTRNTQIDRVSG